MADPASKPAMIYCNGEFLAAERVPLSIDDRGLLFGLGFFETFRTSGGQPHHWRYNRERLERACATAGMTLPRSFLAKDETKLVYAVQRLLREHQREDAVFRYTITGGPAAPVEMLTLRLLPPAMPAEGICLRVLNLSRDNGEWLPRPKSLNYANAWLGAQELQRRAADPSDEGLFLGREGGFLVETTRRNVAWITDGNLRYPDPSLGAVAGTCLAWLLDLGLPAEPARAKLDDLLTADAIVVMNAVRGVTPVQLLCDAQDAPLRSGIDSHEHPIVASLCRQWVEALEATAELSRNSAGR
jgi:4-amino-4-deoxychorismate lyase